MGGIGTKQKKHRENQKKTKKQKQYSRGLGMGGVPPRVSKYCFFFVFFWFSRCFFGFLAKNAKTFGKTKKNIFQRSWGRGGRTKSFHILFFLVFLNVFLISLHGVLPKETQSIFCVIITWRFILFFSVYGIKWWTDNLKSRQVERALTKFKGCEPSCRKVQKVAALVGSGQGDHIYIYMCVCELLYICGICIYMCV